MPCVFLSPEKLSHEDTAKRQEEILILNQPFPENAIPGRRNYLAPDDQTVVLLSTIFKADGVIESRFPSVLKITQNHLHIRYQLKIVSEADKPPKNDLLELGFDTALEPHALLIAGKCSKLMFDWLTKQSFSIYQNSSNTHFIGIKYYRETPQFQIIFKGDEEKKAQVLKQKKSCLIF